MNSVNLMDYTFPIAEARIKYQPNGEPYPTNEYKGIVDSRDGSLISIVFKFAEIPTDFNLR